MTKRSSLKAKAGENHQITIRGNGPLNSQHPQGITPELITARQTAELCTVGERTLWAWSRSGISPPPVKIGLGLRPAVRFKRSEYVAWIEGGCKPVDGRGDSK